MDLRIRAAALEEFPTALQIDQATEAMFRDVGLIFDIPDAHPFVMAEHARWRAAAQDGAMFWAVAVDVLAGFYVLGSIDGEAYLDQLSVLPSYGRRGIGRALLEHAREESQRRGAEALLLTTYGHVPWNGPFYARAGFSVLAEADRGPELRATLAAQRAVLPQPEHRVAMRRRLTG